MVQFLRERVALADAPRTLRKSLRGHRGEIWRYRVGDYRLLCRIEDEVMIVLVVTIGHRREIYRQAMFTY